METENTENSINENDYVIIVDNRGNRIISNIKKDKTANIRKKRIKLKDIVGFQYNSTFEVLGNGDVKLVEAQQAETFEEEEVEGGDKEKDDDEEKEEKEDFTPEELAKRNNQTMFDNNQAQKLTAAEIEEMKKQGVSGQQIIEKLMENSESFNKRTVFSQAKYLEKKKQKHLIQFKAYKATLDALVETYFLKNSSYIQNFRYDSLALFLQYSYIYPGSHPLVFENAHGLVTGAIRQRIGTDGHVSVCSTRPEKQDIKEFRIVHELGFIKEDMENVHFIGVRELEANQTQRFTHLLIASDVTPVDILAKAIPYVLGGAPIVIFSNYIEPLAESFEYLKKNNFAINMRINEIFTREQQVLENRTHPHMMMQGFSGFIFSANRVIN